MKYLVSWQIPPDVGTRLDAGGGPGEMIGKLLARFKPEAAYASFASRTVWIVAELGAVDIAELMMAVSHGAGVYPTFAPVLPLAEIPALAEEAIAAVKKDMG